MGKTEVFQGVRMLKFREVLSRWERQELNELEAAELLGTSERSFRRWRRRFEEEGEAGLLDARLGKASAKRVPVDEALRIEHLYRERYSGFTAKHFHEHLRRDHDFGWGYTWTKTFLQHCGLLRRAPRRGAHRRRRPRRPMIGMMLHQDGSTHRWVPGLDCTFDLVITLDDASSEIYSGFLVEQEGTMSSFRGLAEVFAKHGLPCSFYTDRGSHYFHTPKAGEAVDRQLPTQVGRALDQLGIDHIAAYSPQARGRSERMFRTLQDRLPKELELAGITSFEAANRFLAERFLPEHNQRFAVVPEQAGNAFVAAPAQQWQDALCVQEERTVGNDNTVTYNRVRLQLPASPERAHYVRARVRVHHYPDGTYAVFHGPRCLARYRADGQHTDTSTRASPLRSARSPRGSVGNCPQTPWAHPRADNSCAT